MILAGRLTEANYDVIIPQILGRSLDHTRKIVAQTANDGSTRAPEERISIQLSILEETNTKLMRVRELLAEHGESCHAEDAIDAALSLYLEKHDAILKARRAMDREAKKRAQTDQAERITPAERGSLAILPEETAVKSVGRGEEERASSCLLEEKQPISISRYIPATLRHKVLLRDGGRCTFVGANGRRCGSRVHLQLDHIKPFSRNGGHHEDNLRLLCGQHNQMMADRLLGTIFMQQKREEATRLRSDLLSKQR